MVQVPAAEVVRTEQEKLTRDWHRAEAFLDKKVPLTPTFWANMALFWQAMERFDALENSLRRSGFTGCLQGSNCNDQVVSCRACLPIPTAEALGW